MALPFKRDPEPADRQAEADPFLEFEPERASLFTAPAPSPLPSSSRSAPQGVQPPEVGGKPAVSLQIRHRSGVGAVFVFAVLVALGMSGVAIVAGWGDQIGQSISSAAQSLRAAVARTPAAGVGPSSPRAAAAPVAPPGVQAPAPSDPPVTAPGAQVPPRARPTAGKANTVPSPSQAAALAAPAAGPVRPTAAPSPGIVVFRSSLDLEVYHEGQRIGTTQAGGLTLPPGTVDLVLVSARHEFRQARSVTVPSGQTTSMTIALPNGRLSVNADPWAEVFIDSRSVGTTPLANLPLRIGSHEVVWRHPTLGERRQMVIVKARTPTRAGVDFRR